MTGDRLHSEAPGLDSGNVYTVTIGVRTEETGSHAAAVAEAGVTVSVLMARALSVAVVDPEADGMVFAFGAEAGDGFTDALSFAYVEGDAGVTVLSDGDVMLTGPAVAGLEMTLRAGATSDGFLGTLFFAASVSVRKAFDDDEVSGLAEAPFLTKAKVVHDYADAIATLRATTSGATLTYDGLPSGALLTLVKLDDSRVALSVAAGNSLRGGVEYRLTATLTVSVENYQSRVYEVAATVTALAARGLYSRVLNPGHPAGALATLQANAEDELTSELTFAHLGEGATVTILSGGEVSLRSVAVAGSEVVVSAGATSAEFLGMMLFTASVTVRQDSSLALDDAFYRSAPDYVGVVHTAVAANVAEGATPSYRLVSDDSLRFAMTEGRLRSEEPGLDSGNVYTVTIGVRTEETGSHAAAVAEAGVTVSVLTTRALSVAVVDPDADRMVFAFGLGAGDGVADPLLFAYVQGDAGVTVLSNGDVMLTGPAVAGSEMTLRAGATSDGYLGTLFFAASVSVRKALGDDEVSGLSEAPFLAKAKVVHDYADAIATLRATTSGATLSYDGLPSGALLTLVKLDDSRVALSVAAGNSLQGGTEYRLTATLTVSVENYQSGVYAFSATVTALVARGLYSRVLNPGHPAGALGTLQANAEDELTSELTFAHLGEGATVTILSGGGVSLRSVAVAGSEVVVSAHATSQEFLGAMLFTASVTVRRDSLLALDDAFYRSAPSYVGEVHTAAAANVAEGATPVYRLVSDESSRFAMTGDRLRSEAPGLDSGNVYTVTIEVRTEETGVHAAAVAEAGVTVSVLTTRALSVAVVDPDADGIVFAFGAEAGDGVADPLAFAYVQGDAGLTVLADGEVVLSDPAVAGSEMTLRAGATSDGYLGTLFFAASVSVRKVLGDDEVSGLAEAPFSAKAKVVHDYADAIATLRATTSGATLTYDGLPSGALLTLVKLDDSRVALSVSAGNSLRGGVEYRLTATLTVSVENYQLGVYEVAATVTALVARSLWSRVLNPGHPDEALTTLQAKAEDGLTSELTFAHLGEGATVTILSDGEVSLRSVAVAGSEVVVSAGATSPEFLGMMLFTASVTVRRDSSLALDDAFYRSVPDYVGAVHTAAAANVAEGTVPSYRLVSDDSLRFAMAGDRLRSEAPGLGAGNVYTVTIGVRTEETGVHAAAVAEAGIIVSVLTARALSVAVVDPDADGLVFAFGTEAGDGVADSLLFAYVQGDAGVTVLSDGDVMLTGPAVAGSEMTLRAGATSDGFLGTLFFAASVSVRKAFDDDEVSGLAEAPFLTKAKVVHDYADAIATLRATTSGATLTYGGLPSGALLTLVRLDDSRVALSVAAGNSLQGGTEYRLTATLTVSVENYQSGVYAFAATVTALSARSLWSRVLNPGHPDEALTTLQANAEDELTSELTFAHLGEGSTVTILSGGEVSLRSAAVAGSEVIVSAHATSPEFLGAMLFTASVTVRRDSSLALDDAFYRSAPDYVGDVHNAVAANVPEGAAPNYRLVADDSLQFAMTEGRLRSEAPGLGAGNVYTVTIAVRTEETGSHAAASAEAGVTVSVLTARALSVAVVDPDVDETVFAFGAEAGDGFTDALSFAYVQGDAGVTVLSDGDVMLTGPAVAGSEMTLRAGATSDGYLGTLFFAASVSVRKAFDDDEVSGLAEAPFSAKAKVVHDYADVIATLRATTSGATLTYGGLPSGALLTLVRLDDSRVALSVAAGNSLQGGTEYRLTATLTVSVENYQSGVYAFAATVTALSARSLWSRVLNPGHPAEALATLQANAEDELTSELTFAHLGDGSTVTILSGGGVSLRSVAVAGSEVVVSAQATSSEFLGAMLFTASVTVRRDSLLALDDAFYRLVPGYVGEVHNAVAVNVAEGATPSYRLVADDSLRFAMTDDRLHSEAPGLDSGNVYTVTIAVRTEETGSHAAASAEAGVTVSVLTIRALSVAVVDPDSDGSVFVFGTEAGDGVADSLLFAYVQGDAGLTVLSDGDVMLTGPAVAEAEMTLRAGATSDGYLGTLFFAASVSVRKALGEDEVSGLAEAPFAAKAKVVHDYADAIATLRATTSGATLAYGGLSESALLTLVKLDDSRVALSVAAGNSLQGGTEYRLTATLTVSVADYQARVYEFAATVTALAARGLYSRVLNPGYPAEALTTLQANAEDGLTSELTFAHLGEGSTVTILSGGGVSLRSAAVAGSEVVVSAGATSAEFLGMMLFTASVTVRRDSSLALDDAFYRSAPGYVGEVHNAVAANVAEGATPGYRLVSDESLRFAMTGDRLHSEAPGLDSGNVYTVTIGVRTEETGSHAAAVAEAGVTVSVLMARALSVAVVDPEADGMVFAFGAEAGDGFTDALSFAYVEGDAGVTVLSDGDVMLTGPAVAGLEMTLRAGATSDGYLGTLFFAASVSVRKALGEDEVSGLAEAPFSAKAKVVHDYGDAIATLRAMTSGATLTYGGLPESALLTLVKLDDSRVALSVSSGNSLQGGAEYRLTATLTVSVENYQSGVYAFSATVTALVARELWSRVLNPGHPDEALTTLQANAEDELTSELTFAHFGEGATVTILSGGEVSLRSVAVAGSEVVVSAGATSAEFLGMMLFTASVTVRRDSLLALDDAFYRSVPGYVGEVHTAVAVNVAEGAVPSYRLVSDDSLRFAMTGDRLRSEAPGLDSGNVYTVTIGVRTEETRSHAAAVAEAGVTVSVLTARALSVAVVDPDADGMVFAFGVEAGDGFADPLLFAYVQGDAGVTVLSDGDVMLTGPAVAGSEMTLRAGATSDGYLGTLFFAASVSVRKALGEDEVSGLAEAPFSAKAKVVHDYGDAIATLRATTSGATLAYDGLPGSALLTLVRLDDSRVALSVSAGNSLQGGTEYRLTATLTVSVENYQSGVYEVAATVTALSARSLWSRVLNPGHPDEALTTLQANAEDGLTSELTFAHLGDGSTVTILSGGGVSLRSVAVAGSEVVVSAGATSAEFLGMMLFTASVTVRRDSSLALDDAFYRSAPGYVGEVHNAVAANVAEGATPGYRLVSDESLRFAMTGDRLHSEAPGLDSGNVYTVTIGVRTEETGSHAAAVAEAGVTVSVLMARALSVAVVDPEADGMVFAFGAEAGDGFTDALSFAYVEGDAGVTVLSDGDVMLTGPAVAGLEMTLRAGATSDGYLGTLFFAASVSVRKALGEDEVSGLAEAPFSAKAKVVHDYGDAIATLRAMTSGATLTYGGLPESALLTLVKLDDSRVALSVSSGNSLQGGAEYRLTATLTVSVENYQSGVYAFSATVTALVARELWSRVLNPGHPDEALTTLQANAEDELTSELTFAHFGEGATVTILSGGEVSLRSVAVAGSEVVVSAHATSPEFLGMMLFTASVTVRRDSSLALDDAFYRSVPGYVGEVHRAVAVNVVEGATPSYRLVSDDSLRFAMTEGRLHSEAPGLGSGNVYTVTIGVRTEETGVHAAASAEAGVTVSVLTARALSVAVVDPDADGMVFAFGAEAGDGFTDALSFAYVQGTRG